MIESRYINSISPLWQDAGSRGGGGSRGWYITERISIVYTYIYLFYNIFFVLCSRGRLENISLGKKYP